jgi:hypothetical protein
MKKARMSKSKVKSMMIVFFDIRGVIMVEWVPEGQMVNQNIVGRPDKAPRTSEQEKAGIVEEEIMDAASRLAGSQRSYRESIFNR